MRTPHPFGVPMHFSFTLRLSCCLVLAVAAQTATAQVGPPTSIQEQIRQQQARMEQQRREMEARIRSMRDRIEKAMPGGATRSSQPMIPGQAIRPGQAGISRQSSALQSRLQNSAQSSDPSGLRLTPGMVTYSKGESVLVRDKDGNNAIGRHHVTIGKTKVVLMPDGRLQSFDINETRPTTDEFKPLSIKELETKLLSNPKLRGFKTLRSRHFLYVYNCSDLFIQSTRTIQETMYPAVKKWFGKSGVKIRAPELPLVVIAFATEQEYQNYRRMPDGVVAYYDTVTNNVFLYERSKLSDHAPEIAIKNAISTIAHEGAHQVLHNIGVQQRLSRWPMWLSEGLAEFFAPTSTVRGARWSGIGSTNQLRMMEISRDWQTNSRGGRNAFGNGDRTRQITAADQLDSLDYAYSWSLIHMLAKRHSKDLFRCIRDCSELRPLDGSPAVAHKMPSATDVFEKHFGNEYREIEQELGKHLNKIDYVDPVKTQTHYIVISGGRAVMTTSPEKVKELSRFGGATVKRFANRALAEQAMRQVAN